ncbi:MAG: FGGY-family carbohydrate kinase [Verrucomicrobiae bacterium]|nr:FGGY-family carbohydrate kinase [Verrucomicrobiae bacterium]
MPSTLILALDLGSTLFKAAVFDEQLRRLGEGGVPVQYLTLDRGTAELDAETAWRQAIETIRSACQSAGIQPRDLHLISLASQAQTFTLLDNQGRPSMPLISWMDKRAGREAAAMASQLGAVFHQHCSFPAPAPQLQACQLAHLNASQPKKLQNAAVWVSLPGWILHRLGGCNAIDPNLAAMSGLYSLEQKTWWPDMLKLTGLKPHQCPRLVSQGECFVSQQSCPGLPLGKDVRFCLAGNDQTAAAYGNDCSGEKGIITLGTALVAYRIAGRHRGPFHPVSAWGPYPEGNYYELAVRDEGCLALDWARSQIMPDAAIQDFDACARSAGAPGSSPSNEPVFFYPRHLRTPQAWRGQGGLPQRAQAVYEGIAFELRTLIVDELQADLSCQVFHVAGGGGASSHWLQIIANVLNRPVRRGGGDVLLGAAQMAVGQSPSWRKCLSLCPGLLGAAQSALKNGPSGIENNLVFPEPQLVERYAHLRAGWESAPHQSPAGE